MDKYEFNIKVEQIKKLVGKSDYETAMKIADTIDWRRVRNTNLLSMVAMVYEKNEDYEEAREILLLAFERAPIGKRLLYKLAELALKEGNIDEAEAYYKEFSDLAGDDPRQMLLRYMILKAKGAPAQQLIHSLESYTSQEIDEKWLYELAELYSLAGQADRCVETCDKIMLMFGLGKYVDKAMELKIQYAPLTSYQMDLVENRDKYEAKLRAVEQEYGLGSGRVNVQEPEEEYYDDENQEMAMPEEPDYGDLEARMQEAEVQEGLAREMSRISYEEPPVEPVYTGPDRTRVLDDIRRINRPVMVPDYGDVSMAASEMAVSGNTERLASAMPRPRGMMRLPQEEEGYQGEPVVEEDYADGDDPDMQMNEDVEAAAYEAGYGVAEAELGGNDMPEDEEGEDDLLEIENLEDEEEEPPVLNHLMIEARTPEKGLQIAVEALKQIHKETGIKNPVAKITGEKLSRRGVLASAEKLAGKDLVIEEAGDMSTAALDELYELMNRDDSGMLVVLIDNPKQMESLHRSHPRLASQFECIGSGEIEEEYIPEAAPGRPLYPEQSEAPVRRSPAPAVPETAPEPYEQPVYRGDAYGMAGYEPDIQAEQAYETDYPGEEPYGEDEIAEEAPKKKKGLFHNRKKPIYEELEPEEPYEDDDYYVEESEEAMTYNGDDGPGSHGEEMDIDEFAQYACRYANDIDCSITGKSMLALYERIEIMEEDGVALTRENAEGLIEEAADRAEKPSFGKRLKGIFSTKYDKEGLLILKEEHFIY